MKVEDLENADIYLYSGRIGLKIGSSIPVDVWTGEMFLGSEEALKAAALF